MGFGVHTSADIEECVRVVNIKIHNVREEVRTAAIVWDYTHVDNAGVS